MPSRKYARIGESPVAYECANRKCKWQGTAGQKVTKRQGGSDELHRVCPSCGNNEFYGLLELPVMRYSPGKYPYDHNFTIEELEEILERKFDTVNDARKKHADLSKIIVRKIQSESDQTILERARKKVDEIIEFIRSI